MKIEKLTENKIRVIVSTEDLIKTNTDLNSIMAKAIESQKLFLEILSRAEKEVDFHTEGCKLLIEAFSSIDDFLIFTITKYSSKEKKSASNISPKKPIAKRKNVDYSSENTVYSFSSFDELCDFCNCIDTYKNLDTSKISKNISLYLYNDIYYLVIQNINLKYPLLKTFHSIALEFGKPYSNSKLFISKLFEHGTNIIKKNAIKTLTKHFKL